MDARRFSNFNFLMKNSKVYRVSLLVLARAC